MRDGKNALSVIKMASAETLGNQTLAATGCGNSLGLRPLRIDSRLHRNSATRLLEEAIIVSIVIVVFLFTSVRR